ncbi:UPF0058 family protein [Haladaptatus sp. NG-WS-4]
MQKREYIYLHRLLVSVAEYFQTTAGMPATELTAYTRLEIHPLDFRRSKADHHTAVMTLGTALYEWAMQDGELLERPTVN